MGRTERAKGENEGGSEMSMKYRAFIDRKDHELVIVGFAPEPFTAESFKEWAGRKANELKMSDWGWISGDGTNGKTDRAIPFQWEEVWLDGPEVDQVAEAMMKARKEESK